MMKIAAAIYSLMVGGFALLTWVTYFAHQDSPREQLLPAIVLNFLTLPFSLLMESVVVQFPWIMNGPITMLSIMTGLGGIQVALVWLFVRR